jgi:hypothetical protein
MASLPSKRVMIFTIPKERTYMTRTSRMFCVLLATICCLATPRLRGGDLLFVEGSKDYYEEGDLGEAFRREFEPRMFAHSTWRQRLYRNFNFGDDETLEFYIRPDGSRWVSFRRATPSLTQAILDRYWSGHEFDLKKRLDSSRIKACETKLPADIANQIEVLWQTMVPGVLKEPERKGFGSTAPGVIYALKKTDSSVEIGAVAFGAYHTPAYEEFIKIVDDLIGLCERPASRVLLLQKLPPKIRHLTDRLRAKRE